MSAHRKGIATAVAALESFKKIGDRASAAPTPERLLRAGGDAEVEIISESVSDLIAKARVLSMIAGSSKRFNFSPSKTCDGAPCRNGLATGTASGNDLTG